MNIKNYLSSISNPNNLDESKFLYNPNRWLAINDECKELVKEFEDKTISRIEVIKAYSDYFNGNISDWRKAFTLTMVWGFADTGYGAHRTEKYLNEINRLAINDALKAVSAKDLEGAYKLLAGINGLGVSYISKILYFATRAAWQPYEPYALIFDIRVARALVKLTAPQIYGILKIYPSAKYRDYKNYISLMHQIAKENSITAEALELFLFNYADDKKYPVLEE